MAFDKVEIITKYVQDQLLSSVSAQVKLLNQLMKQTKLPPISDLYYIRWYNSEIGVQNQQIDLFKAFV